MELYDIIFQIVRNDTASLAAHIGARTVPFEGEPVAGYHTVSCDTAQDTDDLIDQL